MSDIQQAGEAAKIKTLWFLRSVAPEQLEELSDDDNENEDECDMDGEETGVENAMHQMSFDDCAEHAFSGLK